MPKVAAPTPQLLLRKIKEINVNEVQRLLHSPEAKTLLDSQDNCFRRPLMNAALVVPFSVEMKVIFEILVDAILRVGGKEFLRKSLNDIDGHCRTLLMYIGLNASPSSSLVHSITAAYKRLEDKDFVIRELRQKHRSPRQKEIWLRSTFFLLLSEKDYILNNDKCLEALFEFIIDVCGKNVLKAELDSCDNEGRRLFSEMMKTTSATALDTIFRTLRQIGGEELIFYHMSRTCRAARRPVLATMLSPTQKLYLYDDADGNFPAIALAQKIFSDYAIDDDRFNNNFKETMLEREEQFGYRYFMLHHVFSNRFVSVDFVKNYVARFRRVCGDEEVAKQLMFKDGLGYTPVTALVGPQNMVTKPRVEIAQILVDLYKDLDLYKRMFLVDAKRFTVYSSGEQAKECLITLGIPFIDKTKDFYNKRTTWPKTQKAKNEPEKTVVDEKKKENTKKAKKEVPDKKAGKKVEAVKETKKPKTVTSKTTKKS